MLISEAASQWLTQRTYEGFSHHTIGRYRLQIQLLIRDLGDMPVDQLTLDHLRSYIALHTHRLKSSTTANRVRVIKSFCKWLVEEDHLVRNPATKLKEPKLPQRVPKALPFDDLERVRDACQSPRERALVEVLFATGCRAAELSTIRRDEVDWSRRAIIVMGKGSKEREVYFGARAALRLRQYLDSRIDEHPNLFVTERSPVGPLLPRQIWWEVKRVARRAGLGERVWPHVFRHTLGTTLLNQGAPLVVVQQVLGHAKSETTQLYAHLSGANRQAAYQRHFVQ